MLYDPSADPVLSVVVACTLCGDDLANSEIVVASSTWYVNGTDAEPAGNAPYWPPILVVSNELPVWNNVQRTLWWRSRVVLRFRNAAANQCLLLSAFQEQGWQPRIDDPLPRVAKKNPKIRLGQTVRSLNDGLKLPVMRFHSDGTGRGVTWESLD